MLKPIFLFFALMVGTDSVVAPNEVCLYSQPYLGGQVRCFPVGTRETLCFHGDIGCVNPFPGNVRSIESGASVTELELYSGVNTTAYLGTLYATSLINNLSPEYQGFHSFKVFPFPPSIPPPRAPMENEICMYTWREFQGDVLCFPVDTEENLPNQYNDQIRSLRFGPGVTQVELYGNASFQL